MTMKIKSQRHYQALQYPLTQIRQSKLNLWVEKVYLYGSCARGEESWNSDIDLLVQLHAGASAITGGREETIAFIEQNKQKEKKVANDNHLRSVTLYNVTMNSNKYYNKFFELG